MFISVPECGIDANPRVLAIEPCPEIPKVDITVPVMSPDLSHVDVNAGYELLHLSLGRSKWPPLFSNGGSTPVVTAAVPGSRSVLADNPETPGQAPSDFGEFDRASWRMVRLEVPKPDGL